MKRTFLLVVSLILSGTALALAQQQNGACASDNPPPECFTAGSVGPVGLAPAPPPAVAAPPPASAPKHLHHKAHSKKTPPAAAPPKCHPGDSRMQCYASGSTGASAASPTPSVYPKR